MKYKHTVHTRHSTLCSIECLCAYQLGGKGGGVGTYIYVIGGGVGTYIYVIGGGVGTYIYVIGGGVSTYIYVIGGGVGTHIYVIGGGVGTYISVPPPSRIHLCFPGNGLGKTDHGYRLDTHGN